MPLASKFRTFLAFFESLSFFDSAENGRPSFLPDALRLARDDFVRWEIKFLSISAAKLKANAKTLDCIKLHDLDEQIKTLFRGYIQGKCDEKLYNELKTEIELEKEKLQKDMDRYLEIDTETDEILANIAEVAANVGKFLKSPIISQKRDILKLILSDCKTEGKNLCFSIAKPFDELLKTPETDKWCAILCNYRTKNYDELQQLCYKIELFNS